MGGKSDYLENKILDHVLGGTVFTPVPIVYVALFNISPGDDGGAEVGGTDYARVAYPNSPPRWDDSVSGQRTNVNQVLFPVVGAGAWGTIVSFALMDAASGGNMLYWGDLDDPRDTEDGDTIQFDPGDMVITED